MRHRTENQIELILIRHGATAGNRERRYVGRTDESLCAEGKDILLANKKIGWYPPADRIFASPMRRCLETARILYPAQEPVRIPEWTEIDFGDFEGKNYEDLKGDLRYQAWIDSGGAIPFPGGESREDFARRCGAGLERMAEFIFSQEENLPERAAAIVHGGTIMSLLSGWGGGKYFDFQVSGGEGYRCVLDWPDQRIRDIRKLEAQACK